MFVDEYGWIVFLIVKVGEIGGDYYFFDVELWFCVNLCLGIYG